MAEETGKTPVLYENLEGVDISKVFAAKCNNKFPVSGTIELNGCKVGESYIVDRTYTSNPTHFRLAGETYLYPRDCFVAVRLVGQKDADE